MVTDPVAFARQVLPQFFKHDNIRSFSRQLNIYGFQRCRSEGREDGHLEFYHEAFLRDRPDLMKNISRGVASQKRAAPGDDVPASSNNNAAGRTSREERAVQMRTLAEDMNLTSNQLKQLVEQLHVHIGNSQSKIVGLINALNTRMELHQRLALPQPPPFLSGSLGIGIHGHGWPRGAGTARRAAAATARAATCQTRCRLRRQTERDMHF